MHVISGCGIFPNQTEKVCKQFDLYNVMHYQVKQYILQEKIEGRDS